MIDEELARRAVMISRAIEDLLPVVHPTGLYKAGRHLVDAGGKRLRPSMLLIAAEASGGDPQYELIISSTRGSVGLKGSLHRMVRWYRSFSLR